MAGLLNDPIESMKPAASGLIRKDASQSDGELFRNLMDRFTVLAETCARFSAEVYRRTGTPIEADVEGTVRRNVEIAETVFGKWSLEILAAMYLVKSIGVSDLKKALRKISDPILKKKLRSLEKAGLIQRQPSGYASSEAQYYLTHKGLMITRLGEPVFLYIRLADGWREALEGGGPRRHEAEPVAPAPAP